MQGPDCRGRGGPDCVYIRVPDCVRTCHDFEVPNIIDSVDDVRMTDLKGTTE